MSLVEYLADAFAGATLDNTKWTGNGAGQHDGYAYVNCQQNAGAPVYCSLRAAAPTLTWTGSVITWWDVVMPGRAGDNANAQLWMMDPAPAASVDRLGYEFVASTFQLVCRGQTGASYAPIGADVTLAYDPVQMRHLRLAHSGTAITWQTSPDGATWTTQRTLTTVPTWTRKADLLQTSAEAFRSSGTNDALLIGAINVAPPPLPTVAPVGQDALQRRTLAELRTWEAWLAANNARGIVGELGWVTLATSYGDASQGAQWAALGDTVLTELDYAGVSAAVWSAGPEFTPGYPLGSYVPTAQGGALAIAQTDAAPISAHPSRGINRWRGVNVAGLEHGLSPMGGGTIRSTAPLVPTSADMWFLARNGVDSIRLPVPWERLQPTLSQPLDVAFLATLDGVLEAARQAGIRTHLEIHNFGRYTLASGAVAILGDSTLTVAAFTDLWTRLAGWLAGNATRSGCVVSLGLMNEPHDLPGGASAWQSASQAAVTALRTAGDKHSICVPGYSWSSLTEWAANHPSAWITDPGGYTPSRIIYEAHWYWDTQTVASTGGSRSGTYQEANPAGGTQTLRYATELAAAATAEPPVSTGPPVIPPPPDYDPSRSPGRLWYVGALGWLRALPDVEGEVDVSPGRIGGSDSSLYGQQWRDTLGYAGTWTWKWKNLLAPQTVFVEALLHGQVRGPLRLLDPRKPNRLPRQVASGGSVSRNSDGFGTSVGGLVYRDLLKVPPSADSLPMADRIAGCQEWLRPNAGGGALYLAGPEFDGTWRAPILPGETVRLSCWVAGLAGAVPELRWIEYERDDTAHSYFSSSQSSDSATLSPSAWQEISVLVTGHVRVGTAGFNGAAVTPRLYLNDTTPAGSIYVTGWQVSDPATDDRMPGLHGACLPDAPPGRWYPGGGSPRVVVDAAGGAYPDPRFYDAGLTLTETITR